MQKMLLPTLLFLAMATSAFAVTLNETVDRTFDIKPGSTIDLSNVNGRITITAWDQPRARMVAVKSVKSNDDDAARKGMSNLKVIVQAQNGGLQIETRQPRHDHGDFLDWFFGANVNSSVTFDLTVPRSVNLEIDNVNGSIHVTDISGQIDVETTNGKIEVARCSGAVDASTTNGAIRAELLSVTAGRSMRFETTNGRITLAVPPGFAANIDADTTNGSIKSDLPVTTQHLSRTSMRGTLNGGGPELKLRTTNGSITIESASKPIQQSMR